MFCKEVDEFLPLLRESPSGAVFNPWWQFDAQNDSRPDSPAIRRKQLGAYLQQRLGKARFAIIGEALGYRGGHFSGIPMTSERILLGKKPEIGRLPQQILAGLNPRRTSKPKIYPDGFSEPTATIVWGTLLKLGLLPIEFVLWNAFPWHSFDPCRGLLSNRTPDNSERAAGLPVVKVFLELFPCDQVVALGKIASAQLGEIGVDAHCIRHPASGGASMFREQIAKILC